jgi:hypothetical protein
MTIEREQNALKSRNGAIKTAVLKAWCDFVGEVGCMSREIEPNKN